MQNVQTYIDYFHLSEKQKENINNFLYLYKMTKKIFKRSILISSINNTENYCNFAIDTSNSTWNKLLSWKYKKIIKEFLTPYIKDKVKEKIFYFIDALEDNINISCNFLESSLNFNIWYTSHFLNSEKSSYILSSFGINKHIDNKKSFVCVNFSEKILLNIKHYEIYNTQNYISHIKQKKMLKKFIKYSDTCMKLTRYEQEYSSQKMYINIYNSHIVASQGVILWFWKIWIPEKLHSIFLNKKIGSIASFSSKSIEIYYIMKD